MAKKAAPKKSGPKTMRKEKNQSAATKKKRADLKRWLTFLSTKQLNQLKGFKTKVQDADPENCERMPPPGS